MFFEGSKKVLRHLFGKKEMLAQGDEDHHTIRPLLLILSGTMRGVYGGGQVIALEEFGLTDVFDTVVGISTGAPTGAYFCAKQAVIGTSIYHEECATPRFIPSHRLRVDVDYITNVFRGSEGEKPLDQKAVHASRSAFYTAVTCARTGEAVLLNAKEASPDIVQAIRASIAIPGITGKPVLVDGKLYTDGIGACPLPIQLMIERFNPTDILVCTNCPMNERSGLKWRMIWRILNYRNPSRVRSVFANHGLTFERELELARKIDSPQIGFLWSDEEIKSLDRDTRKLKDATHRSHQHLSVLLREAQGST